MTENNTQAARQTATRRFAKDKKAWAEAREKGIAARKAARAAREDGFAVSGAEYRSILARYTNASPGSGTKASKLNGLIHNEETSSSLVRRWIEENAIDQVRNRHRTLSAALLTNVCKQCSGERILHERYGLGVDLIRAASLFEAECERLRRLNTPCPPSGERALWDEVVRREAARQISDFKHGRRATPPRFMPLADGTTSNPKTPGTAKACGGYDVWKAFLGRLDPDAALQGFHVDPDGDDAEWTPTDGVDHTSKPVIDADWLASHHATPAAALGLERPDASPRLARLYLVLGDITLARRVDAMADPSERVRDILRGLGLTDREARTGVRFELLMRRYPKADRLKAWNHACANTGVHHAAPGRAALRRYMSHVADAVNNAEALVAASPVA